MLAFTFPGQGSQRTAMGAAWVDHPSWELVSEAEHATGREVGRLLLDASAEELKDTRNAQITTFVASLVVLDAVERVGVAPALAAGHSLGEYTALVATGALGFADGARIVSARGDAMQEAADDHPGTMAAVLGLGDDDTDAACRRADNEVWVANFNAPGQVVIAGSVEGVAAAGVEAKGLGAKKVMPMAVSGAFHTPFMAGARDDLRKALEAARWRAPDVPVVANIDARSHDDPDEWPALLSAQLCSPVRWRQSVQRMVDEGVTTLIELGPGGLLTGMAKRIAPGTRAISVATPDDLDHLLELLEGETLHSTSVFSGEHLFMTERVVVSPAAGVFSPAEQWRSGAPGAMVEVGELLGTVAGHDVRSLFSGTLMGFIALGGERVTASQPIAWLRAT